jgi:hypothetical protein
MDGKARTLFPPNVGPSVGRGSHNAWFGCARSRDSHHRSAEMPFYAYSWVEVNRAVVTQPGLYPKNPMSSHVLKRDP